MADNNEAQNQDIPSPQYSDEFADWIIKQFKDDQKFFSTVREKSRSKAK